MNKKNQPEWVGFSANAPMLVRKSVDNPFVSSRVVKIPIYAIEHSALQARKRFDEVAIVTLADSIRRHGLLQPILVKRSGRGLHEKTHYICIAGEKRLRAFEMLGIDEIPCLLLSPRIADIEALSVVENITRTDLDMFEYAEAFYGLAEERSLTQEELAVSLSTSQVNVANKMRLLVFTPEEQAYILASGLTEQHALALLRIEDSVLRKKVTKLIAERRYTVKRTEEYIDIILSDLIPFVETGNGDGRVESFGSSLNCSINLLRKDGYAAQCERFEHEDEVQFLVRIPKK